MSSFNLLLFTLAIIFLYFFFFDWGLFQQLALELCCTLGVLVLNKFLMHMVHLFRLFLVLEETNGNLEMTLNDDYEATNSRCFSTTQLCDIEIVKNSTSTMGVKLEAIYLTSVFTRNLIWSEISLYFGSSWKGWCWDWKRRRPPPPNSLPNKYNNIVTNVQYGRNWIESGGVYFYHWMLN